MERYDIIMKRTNFYSKIKIIGVGEFPDDKCTDVILQCVSVGEGKFMIEIVDKENHRSH